MERPPDVLDHRRREPGGDDRCRRRRQARYDCGERGSVRDDDDVIQRIGLTRANPVKAGGAKLPV